MNCCRDKTLLNYICFSRRFPIRNYTILIIGTICTNLYKKQKVFRYLKIFSNFFFFLILIKERKIYKSVLSIVNCRYYLAKITLQVLEIKIIITKIPSENFTFTRYNLGKSFSFFFLLFFFHK